MAADLADDQEIRRRKIEKYRESDAGEAESETAPIVQQKVKLGKGSCFTLDRMPRRGIHRWMPLAANSRKEFRRLEWGRTSWRGRVRCPGSSIGNPHW